MIREESTAKVIIAPPRGLVKKARFQVGSRVLHGLQEEIRSPQLARGPKCAKV